MYPHLTAMRRGGTDQYKLTANRKEEITGVNRERGTRPCC